MCLELVTERTKPDNLIQSGWKTFSGGMVRDLRFQNMPYKGSKVVPLDHWIDAEEISCGSYISGFHVYEDETKLPKGARRVYYRRVMVKGVQDGYRVVVARQLYVPSEPDAWPPNTTGAMAV